MTETAGSGSALVCTLNDVGWRRVGKHRGPGLKMKPLAFRGDGRGRNVLGGR